MRLKPFSDTDGFYFRGTGKKFTVTCNGTRDLDYKLTAARHINGVQLIVKDNHVDDSLSFQVIDIDNILGYGAGTVLNEFATDWQLSTDHQNQSIILLNYPAKILANLYIRIKYVSNSTTTNPVLKINFFLHEYAP